MNMLICVPTLSRADLLNKNYAGFAESLENGDKLLILHNGVGQAITLGPWSDKKTRIVPEQNLGVSKSWNLFLKLALDHGYDACAILQDDVKWERKQVDAAKRLLKERSDIDLFLSF